MFFVSCSFVVKEQSLTHCISEQLIQIVFKAEILFLCFLSLAHLWLNSNHLLTVYQNN